MQNWKGILVTCCSSKTQQDKGSFCITCCAAETHPSCTHHCASVWTPETSPLLCTLPFWKPPHMLFSNLQTDLGHCREQHAHHVLWCLLALSVLEPHCHLPSGWGIMHVSPHVFFQLQHGHTRIISIWKQPVSYHCICTNDVTAAKLWTPVCLD